MSARVLQGDCLERMRAMPEASVDAIVCDPPYALTANKKGGSGAASVNLDSPYGRARIGTGNGAGGFMGKAWDAQLPGPEYWAEALRVAKPGAHLVAFGGTRTFHRLACAIEDAGWEIRDTLMWVYGSGFPKSLDVSKALDKQRDDSAGVHAVVDFLRSHLSERPEWAEIDAACGCPNTHQKFFTRSTPGMSARCPTWEQWLALKTLIGFGDEMDAEVWRLNGRKGQPGEAWHDREVIGESDSGLHRGSGTTVAFGEGNDRSVVPITAPATDLAKQWQGWGTALKPAWEPIILARKPLAGTVAQTVAQFSTGALNIDACRIEGESTQRHTFKQMTSRGAKGGAFGNQAHEYDEREQAFGTGSTAGRWPANVVLDEEAAALLDAQSGERGSSLKRDYGNQPGGSEHGIYGAYGRKTVTTHADTGGASRFYYVAKASRREREAGLEGMPPQMTRRYGEQGQGPEPQQTPRVAKPAGNHHPTVKPLALMRWLCRLVTPPGGTILDPFTGSGSTGCAAALEGFRFLGIEQDAEYCEIARRRITHWAGTVQPALAV